MKIEELLSESGHFDTRKVLNRSGRAIPIETLNKLESEGMTIEELQALNVPIYKYRTQITVHGEFPALATGRLGGYKCLVRNENGSLGIKYNAVDFKKKETIYRAMRFCGWHIEKNSQNWTAYQLGKTCSTREELAGDVEAFKAIKAKIDTSLFYGSVRIAVYSNPFFGIYAGLSVEINAIPEGNLPSAILNICGKTTEEIEAAIQAKEREEEAENEQRRQRWEQERIERETERRQMLEKIETQYGGKFKTIPAKPGTWLRLDSESKFRVTRIQPHGKGYKLQSKQFPTFEEALQFYRAPQFPDHAKIASKHFTEIKNAFCKA